MNGRDNMLTKVNMTDLGPIILQLLGYKEVVWLIGIFFLVVWVLLGGLLIILFMHTMYVTRGASRLYLMREPVPGWSRRFYPACVLLIITIAFVQWVTYQLLQGVVPFQ